jgi:hypothetical protein
LNDHSLYLDLKRVPFRPGFAALAAKFMLFYPVLGIRQQYQKCGRTGFLMLSVLLIGPPEREGH